MYQLRPFLTHIRICSLSGHQLDEDFILITSTCSIGFYIQLPRFRATRLISIHTFAGKSREEIASKGKAGGFRIFIRKVHHLVGVNTPGGIFTAICCILYKLSRVIYSSKLKAPDAAQSKAMIFVRGKLAQAIWHSNRLRLNINWIRKKREIFRFFFLFWG